MQQRMFSQRRLRLMIFAFGLVALSSLFFTRFAQAQSESRTDGQCVGDRCEKCTKSGRAAEENLVGLAGEQAFSSL